MAITPEFSVKLSQQHSQMNLYIMLLGKIKMYIPIWKKTFCIVISTVHFLKRFWSVAGSSGYRAPGVHPT